jgi:hypothetical protein
MKASTNFDVREFVSRAIWAEFGPNSFWFVKKIAVDTAEFYKEFFRNHYQAKFPGKIKDVLIVVNNWHTGGIRQYSGYREPACTQGASLSQHRCANAFDCEIWISYLDGTKKEADYKEIHQVIQDNEQLFLAKGVTTIESIEVATGWLHTDFRWIPGQTKIKIVKP